jgi:rhodanese-related sulfurtransferase
MRPIFLALSLSLTSLRLGAAEPQPTTLPAPQPTPVVTFAEVAGVETDRDTVPLEMYAAWPHITLKEAQRLHGMKRVVFADARSTAEWDQAHIPGALPAPLGEFDTYYKKYRKRYDRAKYIVVYCHGVGCHLSDQACKNFVEKGYKNVLNFYSGWPAWSGAKLPTQDKAGLVTTPTPASTPTVTVTATATPTLP